MADRVRYVMDRMAPVFKQLEQSGIFSMKEVKSIIQKRTDFEYLMMRFELTTSDVEKYLQYEASLFDLLDLRFMKYKKAKDGNLNRSELDLFRGVKISFIQHRHYIFERANKKFARHFPFWHAHIAFLRGTESFAMLDKLLGKVLALFPHVVEFWITAGLYELQEKQNIHAARVMMQRGLRVNRHSPELWKTYFELELWNVLRAVERQNLLLKKPIALVDANKAKIDEQKEQAKDAEKTASDAAAAGGEGEGEKKAETANAVAAVADTASEAPLLVVFKYAINALLDLEHDELFFDEEDKAERESEAPTDLAQGGLDLHAKLVGLRVLCELHNASLSLSPSLSKDMESMLRTAVHLESESESEGEKKDLSANQQTLVAALAEHLSLFAVKRALCSSTLLDALAARETEAESASDSQGEREIVRVALAVFVQSVADSQSLVRDLQFTLSLRDKAAAATVNALDTLSSSAVNLLVSLYAALRLSPRVANAAGEGEGEEDQAKEDDVPLETRRELLRERLLDALRGTVSATVSVAHGDEAVELLGVLPAAQQWLQSVCGSPSPAAAAATGSKAKKGRKSVAAASQTEIERETLAEHAQSVEGLQWVLAQLAILSPSAAQYGEADVAAHAVDLALLCDALRVQCGSLSLLCSLLAASDRVSVSPADALQHLVRIGHSLRRLQDSLPLGETIRGDSLSLVAQWSELAVSLLQYCTQCVSAESVAAVARDIAPLLSLHSSGEALLRVLIGAVDDEENEFFETVCRAIIGNVRIVQAQSRLDWVLAYVEGSDESLDALQRAYDFVLASKQNAPQLFAGVSFDAFHTLVVESIDSLASDAETPLDRETQQRLRLWLQRVLEKALEDGCGQFGDRLVEVYREQGLHAKANHVLFKRRRLE